MDDIDELWKVVVLGQDPVDVGFADGVERDPVDILHNERQNPKIYFD